MPSSGGDSGSETSIRYAPYVEAHHENFLTINHEYLDLQRNDAYNPYSTLFTDSQENSPVETDWTGVFYGVGYSMMSFPSVYDMYGKFLAGLDVEQLWEQMLEGTKNNATVSSLVEAQADLIDEDITDNVLPRMRAGLRDINAVVSSSYYIAISNIEAKRDHDVAKFSAELRYKLIPIAAELWINHLKWNQMVISQYVELTKTVIEVGFRQEKHNYEKKLAYIMWPWTLLEQYRANLGALQGATTAKAGSSGGDSGIGGMVSGGLSLVSSLFSGGLF